ncbi:hypothetical protein B7P33_05750 [Sediminicola luteus]|uniref:Uncharacterized protein n=2 Tax=Sediminicola luteus TaxID=319238 RepID=A0A2A4GA94_9FLAO|nr:hypothetical protein B7P33_05750 [Sediminicola luteus]
MGIPILSFGQLKSQQDAAYTLGEYTGKAQYQYIITGIDTLKQGAFKLESTDLEALLEKGDTSFSIQGQFENDQPQGAWHFQLGEYQTDNMTSFSGAQYQINVSGVLQEAKGGIQNGKASGKWMFSNQSIENSKAVDTLFFSTFTFEEGLPIQQMRMEDGSHTLLGRFLRNGDTHDTWTLYSNNGNALENWHFSNGLLTQWEVKQNNHLEPVSIFDGNYDQMEAIPLDVGFLNLIKFYAGQGMAAPDTQTITLWKNYLTYSDTIEGLFAAMGANDFSLTPQVKAPHFQLEAQQQAYLDSIVGSIEISSQLAQNYLDDNHLNLLKRTDSSAQYHYDVLGALQQQFIQPLAELVSYKKQGIVDNLEASRWHSVLFPQGKPSSAISIPTNTGDTRIYQGPNAADYDFNEKSFLALLQMAQYTQGAVKDVATALDVILAQEKQQQSIVALEDEMMARSNRLNTALDSLGMVLPEYQNMFDQIKRTGEQSLASYAQISNAQNKSSEAENTVNCLHSLTELSMEVGQLPEKQQQISAQYTDAVYNPFTATIMDETVKKRIVSAYKDKIIPYLLGQIEDGLSCEEAATMPSLFKALHQRMADLRETDTAKMERKLRKEKDPRAVLHMFNLKPVGQ